MNLKFYRWRHKFSYGPSDWEYDAIDLHWWGGDASFREEKAEALHQEYQWSDKYRGCDIEAIEVSDLPSGWLNSKIDSLKNQAAFLNTKADELEKMR